MFQVICVQVFQVVAHMNQNAFAEHVNYLLVTKVVYFFLLVLQNVDILL